MQMFDNWVLTPKNGWHCSESEVFVWNAPFWDILSGKLEYQLWSQVVKLWNLQHFHPLPKWHFWSLEFFVFKGICNEQKSTYLRCLQKPFFFPRGGLFRLVKKTPRKTCGWFFFRHFRWGITSFSRWLMNLLVGMMRHIAIASLSLGIKSFLSQQERIIWLVNLWFFIIKRLVIPMTPSCSKFQWKPTVETSKAGLCWRDEMM